MIHFTKHLLSGSQISLLRWTLFSGFANRVKMTNKLYQAAMKTDKQTNHNQKISNLSSKEPYQKYGKQVQQLLSKNELTCFDLQFLAKVVTSRNLTFNASTVLMIKKEIKKLTQIDIKSLPVLLELSSKLNLTHYPNNLKESFVTRFQQSKISLKQLTMFPSDFLKQVAYSLFLTVFQKDINQGIEVLKVLGNLMPIDELKKTDSVCCDAIKNMSVDELVRMLNIFRQLKRWGNFVEQSSEVIAEKQELISPKYLLMALISFFQLGKNDTIMKLQSSLLIYINQGFNHKDIAALTQVLHKYKSGSKQIWLLLQEKSKNQLQSSFQDKFALLSGLTRNYIPNQSLLTQFFELEPTLSYVKQLNEKQFIQFFLVIYFHFEELSEINKTKYIKSINEAITSSSMKSVYKQIQHFFLYLFIEENEKLQHLRKVYPDDNLLALLSLGFSLNETIDIQQQKDYQQQLLTRCDQKTWELNKKMIIVEELIRYKLMSVKKQQFKQYFI